MKKFLFGIFGLLFAVPAVADTSGAISSVTVAGLVAQNGTPTPNAPVDIVSNNGVLKYGNTSKNLVSTASKYIKLGEYTDASGNIVSSALNFQTVSFPCKPNTTYTASISSSVQMLRICTYDASGVFVQRFNTQVGDGVKVITFTTGANVSQFNIGAQISQSNVTQQMINAITWQIEEGSTPTDYEPYNLEIYTDGEVETIADSANHTATVATLLGVGDYRDTQNINTGAITRNVGVKVFNGTENWSLWRNGYTTVVLRGIARARTVPLSNITESVSSKIELDGSADLCFYNIVTDFPTVADWKRYIADQYNAGTPVIVIYPLATETTESVAGQTMTTAPVNNRTGGVTGMTITTLLSSGASVVTTIAADAIKIATTAYNSARFSPVVTELNDTIATIRDVVTNTINQTKAIADLQATKQTRPDETCPAGKKCLLVEDNDGTPHWYEIIESPEVQ